MEPAGKLKVIGRAEQGGVEVLFTDEPGIRSTPDRRVLL